MLPYYRNGRTNNPLQYMKESKQLGDHHFHLQHDLEEDQDLSNHPNNHIPNNYPHLTTALILLLILFNAYWIYQVHGSNQDQEKAGIGQSKMLDEHVLSTQSLFDSINLRIGQLTRQYEASSTRIGGLSEEIRALSTRGKENGELLERVNGISARYEGVVSQLKLLHTKLLSLRDATNNNRNAVAQSFKAKLTHLNFQYSAILRQNKIINFGVKMLSNTLYYNTTPAYLLKPSWPGNNLAQFDSLASEGFLASTRYGTNVYISPQGGQYARNIAEHGNSTSYLMPLLANSIPTNGVFLNVGAEFGLEAVLLAKTLQKGAKCLVIESNPANVKLIKKSVELNGVGSKFTIYNKVAANKKGKAVLRGYKNQSIDVQLERADEIIPKDSQVDLALIDGELMEWQILQGFKGIVERSTNLVIIIKFLSISIIPQEEENLKPIMSYFRSKDYRFYAYIPVEMGEYEVGGFKEYPEPEKGIDGSEYLVMVGRGMEVVDGVGIHPK